MTMIPSMRSGLLWNNTQSPEIELIQSKLLALVLLLVRKAATTAAIYCRHNGFPEVDTNHIKKALKFEAMRFFDCDNLEEETDSILESIGTECLEEPDGMSSVLNAMIDEIEDESLQEPVPDTECDCDICYGLESVQERWEAYDPDDDAKMFLKQQLDYIDSTFESQENFLA